MSLPSYPVISPPLTRDASITQLIVSIAMEELALSHVINSEGEKMKYITGNLPGIEGPEVDVDDVLAVTESIYDVLESVMQNQIFLINKLNLVRKEIENR